MQFQKKTLTKEAKTELNKIKEIEKTIGRYIFYYVTNEYIYIYIYNLQNFRAINILSREIYNGTMKLVNIKLIY